MAATAVLGCSAGGTTSTDELPAGVQDPTSVQTAAGALGLYHHVTTTLLPNITLQLVVVTNGLLADELALLPLPIGAASPYTGVDSRTDPSRVSDEYAYLHNMRAHAREARHFLEVYAADSSPALAGHMYAVEGYSELLLADLFCSGIPLSTVDFQGDYTLARGSSTAEVYTHAVALFDTALAKLSDSAQLQPFAAVGKGRALLALRRYAEAAAAVASVPDDYAYQVFSVAQGSVFYWGSISVQHGGLGVSVADREGGNGLDYRTSNDPRTATTLKPDGMYFPSKYEGSGTISITLASGVEARLIEAEAALQANPDDGQWLTVLNHLRQTAWTTIVPATSGPLPDLTDPGGSGLSAARVDLLFRERAFWLYLTAHRQGDLRRLIRQYGRAPETLYPTGAYPGGRGAYGNEIVAPVPMDEEKYNPNYTGCINRNA